MGGKAQQTMKTIALTFLLLTLIVNPLYAVDLKDSREKRKAEWIENRIEELGVKDEQINQILASMYETFLKSELEYKIGEEYREGKGIPQNYQEAIEWYTLSAEQGNVNGQIGLGKIYEVLQQYTKSHKWYNIAGTNVEEAREHRDIVEKKMTPTQILEAQKLAKEWMDKHQKK
jgi:TPR repeat protein